MPTNVEQGEIVQVITRFKDAAGALVEPSSASITISCLIGGLPYYSVVDLTSNGSFWTANWDSTGVDLGNAPWFIASTTEISETGLYRIIDGDNNPSRASTSTFIPGIAPVPVYPPFYFVTESGEYILTEDGKYLVEEM